MRHRMNTRKLGRTAAHRVAMYRNLVSSLLEHEQVETTHAKARELRRVAERMITLGKRGDLHARRLAVARLRNQDAVAALFKVVAPAFSERNGGGLPRGEKGVFLHTTPARPRAGRSSGG